MPQRWCALSCIGARPTSQCRFHCSAPPCQKRMSTALPVSLWCNLGLASLDALDSVVSKRFALEWMTVVSVASHSHRASSSRLISIFARVIVRHRPIARWRLARDVHYRITGRMYLPALSSHGIEIGTERGGRRSRGRRRLWKTGWRKRKDTATDCYMPDRKLWLRLQRKAWFAVLCEVVVKQQLFFERLGSVFKWKASLLKR